MADLLNLASNANVRKLLGKEELMFSGKVVKINSKGKKQERVLVVSNQAMYNLDDKYKCKRRIELDQLAGLTESKISDQFVVHVPSEYDYHYSSPNSAQVRDVIVAAFQAQCQGKGAPKPFPVIATEESDLSINVLTQDMAKRTQDDKKHAQFGSYLPGDHLKLANHPLVAQQLGSEQLLLSLKTIKINRKLKNQERILIVSDGAIYNFNSALDCKRRVALEQITALTMSNKSEQFVIHVPMEYDYHFSSTKNSEVTTQLQALAEQKGRTLLLTRAGEADLSGRVLTHELAQLQTAGEKQERREALSSPKRASRTLFQTTTAETTANGATGGATTTPKAANAPPTGEVVNDTNFEVDDDGDG